MAYEVSLSRRATKDLLRIYADTHAATDRPAAEWYLGLRDTIFSLEDLPTRGTIAPDKVAP